MWALLSFSANALNLGRSSNLSHGKELICWFHAAIFSSKKLEEYVDRDTVFVRWKRLIFRRGGNAENGPQERHLEKSNFSGCEHHILSSCCFPYR